MAIQIQFDLFKKEEESEFEALQKTILDVKASCDRVRRGIYGKHGELKKLFMELDERLRVIEVNLCRKTS